MKRKILEPAVKSKKRQSIKKAVKKAVERRKPKWTQDEYYTDTEFLIVGIFEVCAYKGDKIADRSFNYSIYISEDEDNDQIFKQQLSNIDIENISGFKTMEAAKREGIVKLKTILKNLETAIKEAQKIIG